MVVYDRQQQQQQQRQQQQQLCREQDTGASALSSTLDEHQQKMDVKIQPSHLSILPFVSLSDNSAVATSSRSRDGTNDNAAMLVKGAKPPKWTLSLTWLSLGVIVGLAVSN